VRRALLPALALSSGLVFLLCVARSARAEDAGEGGGYASPQHFMGELKFGPYKPNIDSEFTNGAHPYEDIFGKDGTSLMIQGELDLQLWHRFGSLGVGLASGFFTNTGHGLVTSTSQPSADEAALTIIPIELLAVYRFDVLTRWRVPFVPYGKIGLCYYIWWMTAGGGELSSFTTADGSKTEDARGGTFGWKGVLGLAFQLDVIDPDAARGMDSELGINHSYLFWEYGHTAVSGLSGNGLHLGDNNWAAGIGFEF
jgi:hypothetical protein